MAFDPDGRELARYRKLHLFDITTPDGREFRESATFSRGARVATYDALGTRSVLDLLRCALPTTLPQLAKAGAMVIPGAVQLTLQTCKDHWRRLLPPGR